MNKLRGECEITIDGKPVGLLFTIYTFFLFCEKRGIELDEMDQELSKPTSMSTLLWAGLHTYAESVGKRNKYTIIDAPEILSSLSDEEQEKIGDTLKSVIESVAGSSEGEVEDKKK